MLKKRPCHSERSEESLTKINLEKDNFYTRAYIIERSVAIEGIISRVIGEILNIDWKNSKSFGYSSASLGFMQKINIIKDIKTIDKGFNKKLDCFVQIRNKFAHVYEVSSFEYLLEKSDFSNKGQIKKQLDKYGAEDKVSDFEKRYLRLFDLLVNEIRDKLMEIALNHTYNSGKEYGKYTFLNLLYEEVKKHKDGEKLIEIAKSRI